MYCSSGRVRLLCCSQRHSSCYDLLVGPRDKGMRPFHSHGPASKTDALFSRNLPSKNSTTFSVSQPALTCDTRSAQSFHGGSRPTSSERRVSNALLFTHSMVMLRTTTSLQRRFAERAWLRLDLDDRVLQAELSTSFRTDELSMIACHDTSESLLGEEAVLRESQINPWIRVL